MAHELALVVPQVPPSVVVCGTLAYDYLGYYPEPFSRFAEHQRFNISMQLRELRTEFGGCAMNIAYSLKQLQVEPYPNVLVGRDFAPLYTRHLQQQGIDQRGILMDEYIDHCAQCVVLSDCDGNQITAFHPGPSAASQKRPGHAGVLAESVNARWAIVAPDIPANMIRQAQELHSRSIRFLCDPGQGLGDFESASAIELLRLSRYLILNEHEWARLNTLCGDAMPALVSALEWYVVTLGARGCRIHQRGLTAVEVPAVPTHQALDHTGCGDAFRAGLLAGLARNCGLIESAQVGALVAAINLETRGCQRHRINANEFAARYQTHFGAKLPMVLRATSI